MSRPSTEQGFTLVELLIVVSILGILLAVIVAFIGGLMGQGKEQAFNQDRKAIQLAVDSYYLALYPYNYPTADLTAPGVISFTRLLGGRGLHSVPGSAYVIAHPDAPGGGSYIWYISSTGTVTTTFNGNYP